jgi:molecular chaperone GrpE (heat shock protein)
MSPKSKTKKLEEKVAKLEGSLEDERKRAGKYLSQLKYARADLENLQKRTLMAAEGVSPIEAIGEPFDPRFHEAVLEVETHDQPDGTVIEELRKGYKFKDRVLRASMVKVAKNPGSDEDQEENENE